jgi:hypothetical protein
MRLLNYIQCLIPVILAFVIYLSFSPPVKSRGSSVGTVTDYGLDDQGSRVRFPKGAGIFLFSTASRMTLGPNEPPIQWVRGGSSPGIKQPWREADHSRPSTEIKNAWRCLYIYPYLSTLRQITDSRAVIMKSETNTDSRIRVFNTVNTMSTILSWFYPPLIPHN